MCVDTERGNMANGKRKIYSGKTKDLYELADGNLLILFKDDVTGEDGVVDPGSNRVLGKIKGKGKISLALTDYFFGMLKSRNIPTHLVSIDLEGNSMIARKADLPGRDIGAERALEFVCRRLAYGSFLKRYGRYVGKLQDLGLLVEITLKDDILGDPLINDDAVVAMRLFSRNQLKQAKVLTRRIAGIVESDLRRKGLRLVDIKMEFGLVRNRITLIDEISADSMRVMNKRGKILSHAELASAFLPQNRV